MTTTSDVAAASAAAPKAKLLPLSGDVVVLCLGLLGMFALNPVGLTGSIVQQINHGISTGALFLLVGVVYERRHTRVIADYGGLSKVMPVYAAVFLVMTMSSIGLPALNGFIGEFLILQGVFVANKTWAAFACSGGKRSAPGMSGGTRSSANSAPYTTSRPASTRAS